MLEMFDFILYSNFNDFSIFRKIGFVNPAGAAYRLVPTASTVQTVGWWYHGGVYCTVGMVGRWSSTVNGIKISDEYHYKLYQLLVSNIHSLGQSK